MARAAALIVVIVALTLALVPGARALGDDGDAVEIFRGRQDSYEVAVAIRPESPEVGAVHVMVTLLEAATSRPVDDAEIVIVAHDEQGRPTYQVRALNTPSSPQPYVANITFKSPGAWTLLVQVESEELGQATVSAPLTVIEQSITPSAAGAFVLLGVVAVLAGGSFYLWYSARRRRRASDA